MRQQSITCSLATEPALTSLYSTASPHEGWNYRLRTNDDRSRPRLRALGSSEIRACHEEGKGALPILIGPMVVGRFQQTEAEGKNERYKLNEPFLKSVSPLTLIHFFFQLNLKGSRRLLNPRIVQTSLEVAILSFFNLSS